MIDLKNIKILVDAQADKVVCNAARILSEEAEKRSGIEIEIVNSAPAGCGYIRLAEGIKDVDFGALKKPGCEGYRIMTVKNGKTVIYIDGADKRGCLYGAGKLLRSLIIKQGQITMPEPLNISETPFSKLRGHQLGYRPKTNAYDAWTPEIYSQYIREMAIFGANSVEIMPPKTDDEETGPLLKYDPLFMMQHVSEVCDSMDLDVWIWYPNISPGNWYPASGNDEEFLKPENVKLQLQEREEIFSSIRRIDHLFVPGGDPGALSSRDLFTFMEMQAGVLHKYHPNAKIWLSPQAFNPSDEWLGTFYEKTAQKPEWLGGIVFGPWEKDSLADLRKKVPKDIPIRRYPDITHSWHSQYPVHKWDTAFALTLGRECINPRPVAEKAIHNRFKDYGVIGSLSYSEGINDDVNKFVWSGQDWCPDTPVEDTLREFVRLFVSSDLEDDMVHGLFLLEKNFDGPLLTNTNVDLTLKMWQAMEKDAPQSVLDNYRFEQGLFRAYYDYYIKYRLIHETNLERNAMQILSVAEILGSKEAIAKAQKELGRSETEPVYPQYKQKCWDLADKMFEHIGAQLSVTRHQGMAIVRGAFLDSIDTPLNNKLFLTDSFENILKMDNEEERIFYIKKIVDRTNPGPGGYYDNFNANQSWSRVEVNNSWYDDPGYLETPLIDHHPNHGHGRNIRFNFDENKRETIIRKAAGKIIPNVASVPLEWVSHATSYYSAPLKVMYENIDKKALYVVKTMGMWGGKVRFKVNGIYVDDESQEIRGVMQEFEVPQKASSQGALVLEWHNEENGTGPYIYELWLMKKQPDA